MPTKILPAKPSLDQLKHQARDLIKSHASGEPMSLQRIREFHPRFAGRDDATVQGTAFALADAQLTIAREYGFASWGRLSRFTRRAGDGTAPGRPHHERIDDPNFRDAVRLVDAGDVDGLRALLVSRRELTTQRVTFEGVNYFRHPTLLDFVAENPIRHGRLPAGIVEVARVIIEAGGDSDLDSTLGLVASGCVVRECGVQTPLIDLLCDHGARPDSAMLAAAAHGEFAAVADLLRRGARVTPACAAATGRLDDAVTTLSTAKPAERHLALALAAQFGHHDIVRLLLDAGEDPDRYNPVGAHSHSTPLHQAALAGHFDVVRLLVERGARTDLRDVLYQGTPSDWAEHGGHTGIAAYLGGSVTDR